MSYDFQYQCNLTGCNCRYTVWLLYTGHPEPYIADLAGKRYEYLRGNPCIHDLVRQEVFRRAMQQFLTIRYFRRKASEDLRRDALERLGPVLYNRIDEFVRLTYEQLENSLE
jgi:hypothetical protein